jgi:predicted RNase H-like HicB family nuclease
MSLNSGPVSLNRDLCRVAERRRFAKTWRDIYTLPWCTKGIEMNQGSLAFTVVYLKAKHGYVGFIEELPGVNSHGSTIEEARETLRGLAALIFDEQGRGEQMVTGENVMREPLLVPVPERDRSTGGPGAGS